MVIGERFQLPAAARVLELPEGLGLDLADALAGDLELLADFIQDQETVSPDDAASYQLLRERIVEVLSELSNRERDVLRMRFGLDDGYPRTLEEVGRHFQVTRERIRQIEAKALRKLRHPSRSRKLKAFLEGSRI